MASELQIRPSLPTGQAVLANSLVSDDQDQGLHLWRPLETRRVPRILLQPLKEETKLPDRVANDCWVSSTSDSGPGTLRQCLLDAGAGDVILFNTTTFPPGAPMTITLASELPWIAVDNLTIDASDAGVILDGSVLASDSLGLVIYGAQGDTLRGLQIQGFDLGVLLGWGATNNTVGGDRTIGAGPLGQGNLISANGSMGVQLQDSGTAHNSLIGNLIGTDISGDTPNGNGYAGVLIGWGASQNVIGGAHSPGVCDGHCSLISGNQVVGVQIQDVDSEGNQVLGNFIGTDLSGGNTNGNETGVLIGWGASQNVIGGAHSPGVCDGHCSLISGNQFGVQVQNTGTTGNQVLGNFIGTDISGGNAIGNEVDGILIGWGASQNVIGGARSPGVCDGPCNLISGNVDHGVFFQDDGTTGNQVLGNFVGTNASGDAALPNNTGVSIGVDASDTQVGGDGAGEGNLISGNTNKGVWISWAGTTGNQVLGNLIGTDISGSTAVPNYHGILISESTDNQIGGAGTGEGNLISGNEFAGIWLEYLGVPGNTIAGNFIGTDLTGTGAVPNFAGIVHSSASNNVIGGTEPGAGNLISGNTAEGVHLESNSNLNSVLGNTIGTDVSGEMAIPNVIYGVFIGFGASNNTIGGSAPGGGNLISGNGEAGIYVQNETSVGNHVLGNRIGTNRTGSSSLPNDYGVVVISARETIIGGADTSTPWVCDGPCNLISGNDVFGVSIQGVSAGTLGQPSLGDTASLLLADQANQMLGNFIGTDLAGISALPNLAGVDLSFSAIGNLIGGNGLLGEGNLISGNQMDGIVVRHPLTGDNQISGNRIGTTADGGSALPNGDNGVLIIQGASGNTVGGEGVGMGNLISGHAVDLLNFGVSILTTSEPESIDNQVIGNLIGTNWAGTSAIPNGGGVGVGYLVTGTIIRDNVISGNSLRAILLAETTENEVRDNNIGVAADGLSPLPNLGGIIADTAPNNTLGPGNIIAYNQVGIAIGYPESVGNTITQNSIYANTDEQIVFYEVTQPLAPAPILTGWDESTVSGTACAGCQVEIFANPGPQPAGRTYLGTTTAAGDGTFSLTIGPGYIYLAATATDAEGTTSELSTSLLVGTIFFVNLPVIVKAAGALH